MTIAPIDRGCLGLPHRTSPLARRECSGSVTECVGPWGGCECVGSPVRVEAHSTEPWRSGRSDWGGQRGGTSMSGLMPPGGCARLAGSAGKSAKSAEKSAKSADFRSEAVQHRNIGHVSCKNWHEGSATGSAGVSVRTDCPVGDQSGYLDRGIGLTDGRYASTRMTTPRQSSGATGVRAPVASSKAQPVS